ncbi:MAG: GvpL/GvpF family gas vesicle protein [Streptosporangiaceae bacterium]|nr:GvpL/GvpF family gas vesicle protein [Streptosporangiaceae bacterium]
MTDWLGQAMATVDRVIRTCDVCGNAQDVKTWTFGLDGTAYEIDLCRKDGNALGRVAAGYIAKARKVTATSGMRRRGSRPRRGAAAAASDNGAGGPRTDVSGRGRVTGSARKERKEAETSRPERQTATVSDANGKAAGSKKAGSKKAGSKKAKASRPRRQNAGGASTPAASGADVPQHKGIYVYGILPADIEVTAGIPGVGEHPGFLRDVRIDGLVALVSDVDSSGRLGSPDDLRTHREILDATAAEAPVLPVPFGTVLPSEQAVAEELLAANRDKFTAALDQLEGRVEFQIKGRYVKDAVQGEALSQNEQAARLQDAIHGKDPDAARNARTALSRLMTEVVTARREADVRAVTQAMEDVCIASVALEAARQLDAVHVAFLVAVEEESQVERVVEALAREWDGRIDVQLLGPMAAYHFAGTAEPQS